MGAALDRLARNGVYVLHDRRMPRSRANIDHILVGPSGVVTVDAKRYRGKLESRGGGKQLWVAGRDQSKLLSQAHGQAEAVRSVLASHGIAAPVRPALCLVGTEWPLLFPPREIRDVQLVSPRDVQRLVAGPAVIDRSAVERIVRVLEDGLPPVAGAGSSRGGSRPQKPPQPRGPGPSPRRPPTVPSAPQSGTPSSAPEETEFTVRRWKRFGHDRLYANLADGRTAGHIDVPTGGVAIELEEYAARRRRRSSGGPAGPDPVVAGRIRPRSFQPTTRVRSAGACQTGSLDRRPSSLTRSVQAKPFQ